MYTADQPLAAQRCVNLLVRNGPTGFFVGLTTGDGLHHREMVLHVVEAAVVRKTIEERVYRVFACHDYPNPRTSPSTRASDRELNGLDSATRPRGMDTSLC